MGKKIFWEEVFLVGGLSFLFSTDFKEDVLKIKMVKVKINNRTKIKYFGRLFPDIINKKIF